ncbi:hypothetical protein chiPu_0018916 [Chiloscyllium punctatum]|uniref:Uncharacterized protein n=1 Tax=Chiloscyllium punctatum TaxID=137246 RepID=A0A401RQ85_CHIPU|nr:hypothetical protein [Chiloscyllium punctatum]
MLESLQQLHLPCPRLAKGLAPPLPATAVGVEPAPFPDWSGYNPAPLSLIGCKACRTTTLPPRYSLPTGCKKGMFISISTGVSWKTHVLTDTEHSTI